MLIYIITEAIVAVVAGILLAVCSQKADGVLYGKLDKAGRITNIVLIPVYVCLGLFCSALGFFSYPEYEGLLGVLGWIVAVMISSAPLFSGLGLGFSVVLRKKGRSKQSFAIQFAGLAASGISLILFLIFYGNLLSSLN